MKYFAPTKLSENIRETPEGFLLCIGVPMGRTGEMLYMKSELPPGFDAGPDGKVIMERSEDELFKPSSMASFEGKAFTITHPEQFVDPSNWNELAKGHIQNVRRGTGDQDQDLLADVLVNDQVAIGLIKSGLREVSCGYDADFVQTEPGRGIQRNIIGNHLALVEQGRAGPSYAINDHKPTEGKSMPKSNKISDKLKAIFSKATDEASKLADEELMKDEDPSETVVADDKSKAIDELVKVCNAMSEKLSALSGSKKDAKEEEKPVPAKEEKAADAEEEAGSGIEDRLKALEASVAKILEAMSSESAGDEDGDEEEVSDEDGEEEYSDADVVETGDAAAQEDDDASRAEILAPGIDKSKNMQARALKAVWATDEGKKLIKTLTKGRAPAFDSAREVETLFRATSELLKSSRSDQLSRTKQSRDADPYFGLNKMTKSPEDINAINAKVYGLK